MGIYEAYTGLYGSHMGIYSLSPSSVASLSASAVPSPTISTVRPPFVKRQLADEADSSKRHGSRAARGGRLCFPLRLPLLPADFGEC